VNIYLKIIALPIPMQQPRRTGSPTKTDAQNFLSFSRRRSPVKATT